MASFSLHWRASTKKDLRKLPKQEIVKIVAAADELIADPFPPGHEKLTGAEHPYRIRIGDYRIVYEVAIAAKIVEIQRVRHGKDVYRP